MSFGNIRAFYKKLANDEAFRAQMQQVQSKDECTRLVKEAGYDFTQEEFEEYTAQLLESNTGDGEIRDLNDQELEAVFGGVSSLIGRKPPTFQPMYGVIYYPPEKPHKRWPPIHPQPVYGIPINE
ncbi:Nif11-like leader peptide family natural product precursor [Dendronalium sp. ChiSLP03b]|uniref:Nif11-like leader peptide family natural product precursor n=1 Tax=Dendronalium sp. ChiSLP03b TaxID=3075381 RepID=UPI002AD4A3D0|nr:Nif11-like leader peptide family natural product precursor [Dendronalium sp. ChiSLP03b]MDZ8208950.1 Nif11-like leader peptide family natural product precursor [Dendronalium sp. ChiSLP03b]